MFDILIADDQKSWRDICGDTFRLVGYTCDFAEDASGATEKLETGRYRLICMNLKLVDYGPGTALLQRLDAKFPQTPIIIITGYLVGSLTDIHANVGRLQKRYPNIKKVLLKGNPNESTDAFIKALLEEVKDLLGGPSKSEAGEADEYKTRTKILDQMPSLSKNSTCVSWLHLSDLHLRDKSYEQDKVLKQLIEDVAGEIDKPDGWKPNFIVVTGDITFSAQPDQFRRAGEFFERLLETTHLSKDMLFLVPGNHDADWQKLDKFHKMILSEPGEVIEFLQDSNAQDARKYVFSKFKNYADFVNAYLVNEDNKPIRVFDQENYFYVSSLDTEAGRIVILGLNSAWASAFLFDFKQKKTEDKEHLLLGEPQVDTALQLAQNYKPDIVIALMHHPFDWLERFDREQATAVLQNKSHLILHGHLHETTVAHQISPGTDVIILGAGTTYEKRDHRNGYSYTELDLKAKSVTVHLRCYSPDKGGGWVPDTMSYPQAKCDRVTLSIPHLI